MSELKHTPGPWVIDQHAAFANPDIGHMVYSEGGGHLVCEVRHAYSDNQTANARLISATPELLDACQQILSLDMSEYTYIDYVRLVRRLATSAIKKANS